MSVNYGEVFCAAVDEIVTSRLQGLSFNTTLTCKIVDASAANDGKYIVNDGTVDFTAYSSTTTFQKHDYVYVVVPNNNREEQGIIVGKRIYSGGTPFTFISPLGTIIDITGNVIDQPMLSQGLIANYGMSTSDTQVVDELAIYEDILYEVQQVIAEHTYEIDQEILDHFKELYAKLETLDRNNQDYIDVINEVYTYYKENLSYIPIEGDSPLANPEAAIGLIQAITLWSKEFDEPFSGYDRIGISGEFMSHLSGLNASIGNYGLRLLVTANTDAPLTAAAASKYGTYELVLDSAADMYGNPYSFSGYSLQEKVFDISNLGSIIKLELQFYQKPGSFKDINKKSIPVASASNIFIKNPMVCFGYDIAGFGTDRVQIFSLESPAYTDQVSEDENVKTIRLRWVHKDANGLVHSLDWEDIQELENTEIRWYQYQIGSEYSDEYAGLYWKRIEDTDSGFINGNLCEYRFIPNVQENTNQIKAIIKQDSLYYASNIITFYNENEVVNQAVLNAMKAFSLKCLDGSSGNYYRYNAGNVLVDHSEYHLPRTLQAFYTSSTDQAEGLETELSEASMIEWTFPTENTMLYLTKGSYEPYEAFYDYRRTTDLVIQKDKKYYQLNRYPVYIAVDSSITVENGMIPGHSYYELSSGNYSYTSDQAFKAGKTYYIESYYSELSNLEIGSEINSYSFDIYEQDTSHIRIRKKVMELVGNPDYKYSNYLIYGIENYYFQGYLNNTVYCKIKKSGAEYNTQLDFYFGKAGSSGSPYTLVLTLDPSNEPYLVVGDTERVLGVTARLFDSENIEIDITRTNIAIDPHPDFADSNLEILPLVDTFGAIQPWHKSVQLKEAKDEIDLNLILWAHITWAGSELHTYCVVPIVKFAGANQTDRFSRAAAPTEIVYSTSGEIYYYQNELKMYSTTNRQINGSWSITCEDFKEEDLKYLPTLNDSNVLQPVAMYVKGMPVPNLQFTDLENNIWSTPIITLMNRYPSCMLDNWESGTVSIDTEGGSILSTMISAGSKDENNLFSGVMMGDWSGTCTDGSIADQTGLYGFHKGEMSFGFYEDGTGFMGKASTGGRIYFDGTESVIKSQNYVPSIGEDGKIQNGAGMKIGLAEGYIDACNFKLTSRSILLDATAYGIDPYFKISGYYGERDENGLIINLEEATVKDLIYISDSQYQLRSSNYALIDEEIQNEDGTTTIKQKQTGMLIDLVRGVISIGEKFIITEEGVIEGGSFAGAVLGTADNNTIYLTDSMENNAPRIENGILYNCALDRSCVLSKDNFKHWLNSGTAVSSVSLDKQENTAVDVVRSRGLARVQIEGKYYYVFSSEPNVASINYLGHSTSIDYNTRTVYVP